jgi:hypothetical protein
MSDRQPHTGDETPLQRAEERLHEAAGEAEEAAWETLYEAEDMAKDALNAITPHKKKQPETEN